MADVSHVMTSEPRQLAVLIDGDSIDPEHLGRVLAKAGRYGTTSIRCIYGDHDKLSSWEECISNHGIESVPNSATYKNAADVMLIIDTAEILRSGRGIDGFCIIASDNDFAGLARWIRENKAYVAVIWSSGQNEHTPFFEKTYHQRSIVESVFSSLKCRFTASCSRKEAGNTKIAVAPQMRLLQPVVIMKRHKKHVSCV